MKPSTPAPAAADPCAGFALVDVLVALALLAVLSGLMASFIGQFRTLNRMERDLAARAEMNALAGYLERSIGGALPLPFIRDPSQPRTSLEGTASEIRFVTIARQGARTRALRETAIALAADRQALVQTFAPRRLDPADRQAAALSIDLATDIERATFAYLAHDASGAAAWRDDWLGQAGLPAAVRIEFAATRNGKTVVATARAPLAMSAGELASGL